VSAAAEKSTILAQEHVATIARVAGANMDEDLERIVKNAYATAYLRGSADAIEDYLATYIAKTDELLARIAVLDSDVAAALERTREESDVERSICGRTGRDGRHS